MIYWPIFEDDFKGDSTKHCLHLLPSRRLRHGEGPRQKVWAVHVLIQVGSGYV